MGAVIRAVTAAMAEAGFPEWEVFAIRLALEEAVVNAHKHGHREEWSQPITVRYRVGAGGLVAQVEDRGPGSTRGGCRTRSPRRTWTGPAAGACC
jgi:anti-sigma regulatory factor (Ser/Thr protein kinase)